MRVTFDINVKVTAPGLARLAGALERIAKVAERAVGPVPARGLRSEVTGDRKDGNMHFISFRLSWAKPAADADIGAQELTLTVDGVAQPPELLSRFTSSFDGEGLKDAIVVAELVNIDTSGNRQVGAPAKVEFVLSDSVPPPDAGPLAVAITGDRLTEDAPAPADPGA